MNDKPKPPLNFNSREIPIIGQPKFVLMLTVDMTNGQVKMETAGPDVNAMGVVDILMAQAQSIWRAMMLDPAFPKPGIAPAGDRDIPGGIPGGTNGGSNPQ
jgi:hypothetical protein